MMESSFRAVAMIAFPVPRRWRKTALAGVPIYHWGDLDSGGVRIFCHLERALAERGIALLPHLMDPVLLSMRGVPGEKQIRRSDAPRKGSSISNLWDALLETGLTLEQESQAPRRPQWN